MAEISSAQHTHNHVDNPDGESALTSCSKTTFTCGFNPGNCSVVASVFSITNAGGMVLKSAQLTSAMEAAGIDTVSESAIPSSSTVAVVTMTATASVTPTPLVSSYTAGQMVGVGAGVGIPLLLAIGILTFLLVREKKSQEVREIVPFEPEARDVNSWALWTDGTQNRRSFRQSLRPSIRRGSELGASSAAHERLPPPLPLPVAAELDAKGSRISKRPDGFTHF